MKIFKYLESKTVTNGSIKEETQKEQNSGQFYQVVRDILGN